MGYQERNRLLIVLAMIVIVLGALLGTQSYTVVDANSYGIKITLGKVQDTSLDSGLHFKRPFLDRIVKLPATVMMVQVKDESTASKDKQEIKTDASMQYVIKPEYTARIYKSYKFNWQDTQIYPLFLRELKTVTADYTAEELIQIRQIATDDLYRNMADVLEPLGFSIISVSLENLDFNPAYWDAVELTATEYQNTLLEKMRLEKIRTVKDQEIVVEEANAKMRIILANATAVETVLNAQAQAEGIRLKAEAEAYGASLNYNVTARGIQDIQEQLTDEYIQYIMAGSGWNGELPTFMMGDSSSGFLLDLAGLTDK